MIFTVFQYIPLIEEETHGNRVELAKKEKQSDPADGDNDNTEDNCDDDTQEDLGYLSEHQYRSLHASQHFHSISRNHFYKYLRENVHTPPPKA